MIKIALPAGDLRGAVAELLGTAGLRVEGYGEGSRAYRLTVGPGGQAARTLAGQRAGEYPVEVAGGGRATLVVGGEPGP